MENKTELSINARLHAASTAAYLELESRCNFGRGITTHSELYRLVLVLRATTRDIEWERVENPLPENPFDVDIEATRNLVKDIRTRAGLDYFQKSPTNILLAGALELLDVELKRYAINPEPKARSARQAEGEPGNHPLEIEWQEVERLRLKAKEEAERES